MAAWAQLRSRGRPEWRLSFDARRRCVFSLGRHPSCALILNDMHISSKHVTLTQRAAGPTGAREVIVEDSSSNGTWLDGQRLSKGEPLQLMHGSELTLPSVDDETDNYTFVFEVLDEAAVPPQARPEHAEEAEQWSKLETLQTELSLEASRLAASVYLNDDALKQIAEAVGSQASGGQAGWAKALRDMEEAHASVVELANRMLGAMRAAETVAGEVAPEPRAKLLQALDADRFAAALEALGDVPQLAATDDENDENDVEEAEAEGTGNQGRKEEEEEGRVAPSI